MTTTIEDVKATLNRISSCREIVSNEIDLAYLLKASQIEIHTTRSCAKNRMKDAVEKLQNVFLLIPEECNRYTIEILFSTQRTLRMDEMNDFSNLLLSLPFQKELSWGVAIDEGLGDYIELILIATKYSMTFLPERPWLHCRESVP